MPGPLDAQGRFRLAQLFQPTCQPGQLRLPVGQLRFQPSDLLPQQDALSFSEKERQSRTLAGQRGDLASQGVVGVTVAEQRLKQLELGLGAADRVVGLGQVFEVPDDALGPGLRVEGLQHVAADEVGEVAHGLHRHRLLEQLHGLLGFDAERAPEVLAVLREMIVNARPGGAEALLQRQDLSAEIGEVIRDGQASVGHHEEPVGLPGAPIPHPEDLGEGNCRLVPAVGEDAEDDRVCGRVAQRDRPGRASFLVPLRLVVAEHIRAQAALPGLGTRGLVIGDAVGRKEQRGDGVHDR